MNAYAEKCIETNKNEFIEHYLLNNKRISIIPSLVRLEACIISKCKIPYYFNLAKAEILSNPVINEESFADLKKWIQSLDLYESNYSYIEEVINQLIND